MNLAFLVGLGVACAATAACAAPATPSTDNADSHRRYRCVVLGDSESCATTRVQPPSTRLVPGPFATKLIVVNGLRPDEAILEARSIGEEPSWRVAASQPPCDLSDRERYQRWLGQSAPDRCAARTVTGTGFIPPQ